MSQIKAVVPWLIFPSLMVTALFSLLWLKQAGLSYGIAVFVVLLSGVFVVAILEQLFPYRQKWNKTDQDVQTDFIHLLIAQVTMPKILTPFWHGVLAGSAIWLSNYFGNSLWPHNWPWAVQLFTMLIIAEFGRYWVHRAAHTFPWMWRFHAVHHSPNRLYWMNAGRFHPIEKVVFLIPETIPFILLGTNEHVLSLYFVFNGIHGVLQHSNIHIKSGFLNWIFSLTELHRWHHSKQIHESNNNYGNNLIVWDIVFGTYYLPKDKEVGDIGLLNPEYPKNYLGQLTAPFRGRLDQLPPSEV